MSQKNSLQTQQAGKLAHAVTVSLADPYYPRLQRGLLVGFYLTYRGDAQRPNAAGERKGSNVNGRLCVGQRALQRVGKNPPSVS